ncbi:Nitrogen assimilation transcription factor nit-4, partial [Colletotrichum shisoi]
MREAPGALDAPPWIIMSGQNKPTTQTLRPLLPAPRALQPLPPRLPPASSKKRLIPSTKVACNTCRSKKKACDGKRPACTPCTELGTQCVYISANETETAAMALKRENQMLRDMLSQLTAMPEDVAHQTLKKLKFAVDPFSAFRTIRPSAPKDVRQVLPHVHSDIEFELTRRHPSVYPQIRRLSRGDVLESAASRPAKVARIASSSGESRSIPGDVRDRDTAEVTLYNPSFASDVGTRPYNTAFFVSPTGPAPPPPPVRKDPRLRKLNIGFWTVVPITNQDAADAISIYLETDHPVLGLFDADLFLDGLVRGEVRYCSSLLVNALLAFACQAYAAKNPEASRWSQEFEEEANKLWLVQNDDTLPTIAALAFLIQSCGCNGNGELDVRYIKETAAMAKRLKLFGCPDAYTFAELSHLSEAKARATAQTAWGVFDTLKKYSRLLVWADNLPESMKRCEHSPYQVLVCHIWFHGTVLYLLRPFIPSDQQHGFRSWSPSADRIHAFFAASIEQLKELAELYASCPQSTYSIFGHPALLHVANAVASDVGNPEWRIYFMSCIRAYQALYSSFTVAEVIAGGLLSMVVRKGAMDTAEAFGLLQELRAKKSQKLVGRATGMFVTDFDLAVTDREAARADRMMEKFEEMTILDEFTHG